MCWGCRPHCLHLPYPVSSHTPHTVESTTGNEREEEGNTFVNCKTVLNCTRFHTPHLLTRVCQEMSGKGKSLTITNTWICSLTIQGIKTMFVFFIGFVFALTEIRTTEHVRPLFGPKVCFNWKKINLCDCLPDHEWMSIDNLETNESKKKNTWNIY